MTDNNRNISYDIAEDYAVPEQDAEYLRTREARDAEYRERQKRDAERKARDAQIAAFRLLLDYLKNAHEACEGFGLKEPSPVIIAALIVAQSINIHGEAVTDEMADAKSSMIAALDSLAFSIARGGN